MALPIEIEVPQAVIFDRKNKKDEKMIRLEPRLEKSLKYSKNNLRTVQ